MNALQIVATTTPKYLKEVEDVTINNQPVFAMLRSRGRIETGANGTMLQWPIKLAKPEVQNFGAGVIDYVESDKYRYANLEWGGVYVSDSMTEKERLQNQGDAQILDRYAKIVPDMEESLVEQFGLSFYEDALEPDDLAGIESFMGNGGSVTATDLIAIPDDVYAGMSTAPGSGGAVWSADMSVKPNAALGTDWPSGKGQARYGAWSPKLVNWSSTRWADGTHTTFKDTGERAIRQAIKWCTAAQGQQGRPDLCILASELYTELVNGVLERQRILAPARRLTEIGFPGGFSIDGVDVIDEYGVPANTGYILNTSKITLHALTSQLFDSKGPDWDPRTASWLFLIYFFGQWQFKSPRWFAKLYNYA